METVRILRWMNGSNDVEVTTLPGGRVDEKLDWSFEALKLFKNGLVSFQMIIFDCCFRKSEQYDFQFICSIVDFFKRLR